MNVYVNMVFGIFNAWRWLITKPRRSALAAAAVALLVPAWVQEQVLQLVALVHCQVARLALRPEYKQAPQSLELAGP